jgi:hypothetical protein
VLALVIGIGALRARRQFQDRREVVAIAVLALSAAWIGGLVSLRRKSARLRAELPPPPGRPKILAAFPLLQLAGLVPSALLHDPESGYLILALTSIVVFVVVLLSGFCFALIDVPVRWEAWIITLITSVVAGMVLSGLALSQLRIC